MKIKSILSVFKKEVLEILRDKKTLAIMIFIPLLLYPIMIIAGTQIGISLQSTDKETPILVGVKELPNKQIVDTFKTDKESSYSFIVTTDYKKDINDNRINLYLDIDNNKYTIYADASGNKTNLFVSSVGDCLDKYKALLVEQSLVEQGFDADSILEPIIIDAVNIANDESMVGKVLGSILPMILIMMIMMGAMYPAIDVTSGEKERGTLETLLTLPISNIELITGKFLAVALIAVITGILNYVSMLATGAFLLQQMGAATQNINVNIVSMLPGLFITLLCVCVFALFISAAVMCVCIFARSFKEANNYLTPFMILVMIPSMLTMNGSIVLNGYTAAIPVLNVSLLIQDALMMKYNLVNISICLFSNIVFAFIAVYILSKLFNSEDILFSNSNTFSLFDKRDSILKKDTPTMGDTMMIVSIAFLLLVFVGTFVQTRLGAIGVFLTQVGIISIAIGAVIYLKCDIRKTFKLYKCNVKSILASILLFIGLYPITLLINTTLLQWFPSFGANAEGVVNLMPKTALMSFLLVGVCPAICEEFFFRGFVLSAFKKKNLKLAIVVVGLLFGLYHMSLIKLIPTTMVGMFACYLVIKSGSIIPAMLLHFLNNSLSVLLSYNLDSLLLIEKFYMDMTAFKVIGIIMLFIVTCIITIKLLRKKVV
ncbi:MAG: ABC transporter permease subunit/CPBP intramembrane protease [Erysipelotrichaceae bacterium]